MKGCWGRNRTSTWALSLSLPWQGLGSVLSDSNSRRGRGRRGQIEICQIFFDNLCWKGGWQNSKPGPSFFSLGQEQKGKTKAQLPAFKPLTLLVQISHCGDNWSRSSGECGWGRGWRSHLQITLEPSHWPGVCRQSPNSAKLVQLWQKFSWKFS